MKNLKFLEAIDQGPYCIKCKNPLDYIGCDIHKDIYPVLSKNSRIKMPICQNCTLTCSGCSSFVSIPKYVRLYATSKKKTRMIKTRPASLVGNPLDKINIKNPIINTYKKSIRGLLELVFSFDIGAQLALDIKDDIGKVNVNESLIHAAFNRISYLLFALQLIRLSGLGSYEKKIMQAEISKLYNLGAHDKV
jgi:hypothetical protein